MPAWLILSIMFFVAGVGAQVWRVADRASVKARNAQEGGRRARPLPLGWASTAAFLLGLVFLFVSSYNPVGTKEVGVVTSFGKTAGHLSNGPHLTAPWNQVHEMDAAIQTDSFIDSNGIGNGCTGIPVRIANQQTGCASVSFQWRIRPTAVDELYQDYRSFAHVRDALVTRKLTAAVNEAFAHYNPLDSITSGLTATRSPGRGKTLQQIAADVTAVMKREIGGRIEVLSTILPIVTFDQATQQLKTNQAQAKANAALAKSVTSSPNVLVARCLDDLEAMVKTGQAVPAGFSCWPGGGVAAVIAGATSKK